MEGAGATGLSPSSWAGMPWGAPWDGADPDAQPSSYSFGEDEQPCRRLLASVPFPSARCSSHTMRQACTRIQHPIPEQSAWTDPIRSPSSLLLLKALGMARGVSAGPPPAITLHGLSGLLVRGEAEPPQSPALLPGRAPGSGLRGGQADRTVRPCRLQTT